MAAPSTAVWTRRHRNLPAHVRPIRPVLHDAPFLPAPKVPLGQGQPTLGKDLSPAHAARLLCLRAGLCRKRSNGSPNVGKHLIAAPALGRSRCTKLVLNLVHQCAATAAIRGSLRPVITRMQISAPPRAAQHPATPTGVRNRAFPRGGGLPDSVALIAVIAVIAVVTVVAVVPTPDSENHVCGCHACALRPSSWLSSSASLP